MISRRSLILQSSTRLIPTTGSTVHARPFHSSRAQRNVLVDISYQIFQHGHTYSGLSWALSIPLTACYFRVAFAPVLYLGLSRSKIRQSVRPLQIAHETLLSRHLGTLLDRGAFRSNEELDEFTRNESERRTTKIQKDYKIQSQRLPTVLGLGFLPIWVINVGVLQAMASVKDRGLLAYVFDPATLPLPEPGFETEGFLWITSLSDPDPTYLLPAVFGALLYSSATRTVSRDAAKRELAAAPLGSRRRIRATFQAMYADIVLVSPIILAFIMAQAPAALGLFFCGSAATQTFLPPLLKRLVGSDDQIVRRYIPQIPKLKHRHRDMHSMDEFRPPSGNDSQPVISLGPQATLQDSKPSRPGRIIAQVPGSPAAGPTYHHRR